MEKLPSDHLPKMLLVSSGAPLDTFLDCLALEGCLDKPSLICTFITEEHTADVQLIIDDATKHHDGVAAIIFYFEETADMLSN